MNKETYEALKKTMHHCEYGGANDKDFWDNFHKVESWINEVAKEYEDENKEPISDKDVVRDENGDEIET